MELLFLRHFITELIGIVPAELQKEVTLMPDDVRVHYNSSKPAQFQTLAYNQGKASSPAKVNVSIAVCSPMYC